MQRFSAALLLAAAGSITGGTASGAPTTVSASAAPVPVRNVPVGAT